MKPKVVSLQNVVLNPEETGYLLGMLQEHINYYRTLAGSARCSAPNKARYLMLEALWLKLSASITLTAPE